MDKVFYGANDTISVLDKVLQEILPNNPENSWNLTIKRVNPSLVNHLATFSTSKSYILLSIDPEYNDFEYITVTKDNIKSVIKEIADYYGENQYKLLKIAGFEEESEPIVMDKLPSKFYIKCNSEEESKACEKWAKNRNLVLIHDFVFTPNWPYFLVDLNKKQYITNNNNLTYRQGTSNEWNLTSNKELTLKDLGITIESNEENKTIEESTVKEIFDDIVAEEPKESKLFKKDDYIVIYETCSVEAFKCNYCYKQRKDDSYLKVYEDNNGSTNGWGMIGTDTNHWRYATIKEVAMYDKLGKPFDVTTLNKLEAKVENVEMDYFLKDDYIVIFEGSDSDQFVINHCYKQRKNESYLRPYYDSRGSTTNGFTSIFFSNENKWRYATPLEIEEYNRLGKPFDTSKLSDTSVSEQFYDGDLTWILGSMCTVNKSSAYNPPIMDESNKSIYNVDLYGITPEPEI